MSPDVDEAASNWSGSATGTYGAFAIDASGNWTFTLDQDAADHLAEGASDTQTFTATVTDDKGATATETVTITITGTDNSPVVVVGGNTDTVVEAGNLDKGTVVAAQLTAGGTLTSTEVDEGAAATWRGSTTGTCGAFEIDASGNWTLSLDQDAADIWPRVGATPRR